jgi:hypothetical protein
LKSSDRLIIITLILLCMLTLRLDVPEVKSDISGRLIEADLPWGDWMHYHNYDEIVDTLLYLNSTYPNIVDVLPIGRTWQNRTIYCIRLTNETNPEPKPNVLFVGYHHAREPITAELSLYYAVSAATEFGVNEAVTRMLNLSETYVVIALNADGLSIVSQNEWQRKNAHPIDEDGDGLLDEDPPDDADGDGYVEALYQWDGSQWYPMGWEGVNDDGDSRSNEDWVGGADLNRNYGYQWNATCSSGSNYTWAEDYRGAAPFSEPETQAIGDLAMQHSFTYAVSFHSGAETIVYPWGYTSTQTLDDQIFKEIAGNLSALVGAPYEQAGAWYTTSGVWDDWMYGNRSSLALTCEIFENDSAWQYEIGQQPDILEERGIFQAFNPDPIAIEPVIQRWLPVFTYVTTRAIDETHNIAIANTTSPKTVIGQGFSTNITVTVANQGAFEETLQVAAYVNASSLGTQNITLHSRTTKNIIFSWNTTGYDMDNYVAIINATPVKEEVNLADNTVAFGIRVSIPGDFNGDFKVGPPDFALLATAFGSTPDKPRWNPNCDVDDNNKVGPYDFAILSAHYGQHLP